MTTVATYSISGDWVNRPLPPNLVIESGVYLESAYSFLGFASEATPGLILREGSGIYDHATFVAGPQGQIEVGPYSCINASYLICNDRITIGAHCLLGWGAVVSDSWPDLGIGRTVRRATLRAVAAHEHRCLPPAAPPRSVVVEDNVWIGFEAVILPGVRLGRGCVVGSRSVIAENVPPYAVVVGNPPRIIRWLEPNDTAELRELMLKTLSKATGCV
jgi:acetyltransferase-like isoleucine patch superfamily enzyme